MYLCSSWTKKQILWNWWVTDCVNLAFTMQSFQKLSIEKYSINSACWMLDSNWDLFDLRVAEAFSVILVITETWNRKGAHWPGRWFSMRKIIGASQFYTQTAPKNNHPETLVLREQEPEENYLILLSEYFPAFQYLNILIWKIRYS